MLRRTHSAVHAPVEPGAEGLMDHALCTLAMAELAIADCSTLLRVRARRAARVLSFAATENGAPPEVAPWALLALHAALEAKALPPEELRPSMEILAERMLWTAPDDPMAAAGAAIASRWLDDPRWSSHERVDGALGDRPDSELILFATLADPDCNALDFRSVPSAPAEELAIGCARSELLAAQGESGAWRGEGGRADCCATALALVALRAPLLYAPREPTEPNEPGEPGR